MEVSITDKAEELEIGKPTKVGFFFFFTLFFLQMPNYFFYSYKSREIPHLSRGVLKARRRHRYYSNEFSQVILMNT